MSLYTFNFRVSGFTKESIFLSDFDVLVVCEDGGDPGAHVCVWDE